MNRNEKLKNLIRGIGFGLVVVALLVLASGCGKKSGKGSTNPYSGYIGVPGSPGYGGNGSVWAVGAGFDMSGSALLVMQFSTPNMVSGYPNSVTLNGELIIYQDLVCGARYLAAGRYVLTPTTPSLPFDGSLVMNATFNVTGPQVTFTATLPYARLFNTRVCGYDGMTGQINMYLGNSGCSLAVSDQVNAVCR